MGTRIQGAEIKGPLAHRHRRPKGLTLKKSKAQVQAFNWLEFPVYLWPGSRGLKGPRIQASDARVQDARSNRKPLTTQKTTAAGPTKIDHTKKGRPFSNLSAGVLEDLEREPRTQKNTRLISGHNQEGSLWKDEFLFFPSSKQRRVPV